MITINRITIALPIMMALNNDQFVYDELDPILLEMYK